MTQYSVDLKLLQETTDKIETLVKNITEAIGAVHSEVAQPCKESWEGITAVGFQERHSKWSDAITSANGEMAEMKAAAQTAFDNYTAAKTTNLSMLGR